MFRRITIPFLPASGHARSLGVGIGWVCEHWARCHPCCVVQSAALPLSLPPTCWAMGRGFWSSHFTKPHILFLPPPVQGPHHSLHSLRCISMPTALPPALSATLCTRLHLCGEAVNRPGRLEFYCPYAPRCGHYIHCKETQLAESSVLFVCGHAHSVIHA